MISSSYKLQEEKVEADVIHHPKRSRLQGLLGSVFYLRRITRSASQDSFSTP